MTSDRLLKFKNYNWLSRNAYDPGEWLTIDLLSIILGETNNYCRQFIERVKVPTRTVKGRMVFRYSDISVHLKQRKADPHD